MGHGVLRRHIWGYTVCLCPIKRTPGLYELNPIVINVMATGSYNIDIHVNGPQQEKMHLRTIFRVLDKQLSR